MVLKKLKGKNSRVHAPKRAKRGARLYGQFDWIFIIFT